MQSWSDSFLDAVNSTANWLGIIGTAFVVISLLFIYWTGSESARRAQVREQIAAGEKKEEQARAAQAEKKLEEVQKLALESPRKQPVVSISATVSIEIWRKDEPEEMPKTFSSGLILGESSKFDGGKGGWATLIMVAMTEDIRRWYSETGTESGIPIRKMTMVAKFREGPPPAIKKYVSVDDLINSVDMFSLLPVFLRRNTDILSGSIEIVVNSTATKSFVIPPMHYDNMPIIISETLVPGMNPMPMPK